MTIDILNSPLRTVPYRNKKGVDYRDFPIGKRRQRKIEHVRSLFGKDGWSKGRVLQYAIHGMNMAGNDIVEAMQGTE